MNSNLVLYDIENFLKKYTRFMSKNIYINQILYNHFMTQYTYLYNLLDQDSFLYSDNPKYKQMMNIKKNQTNLLKLHNQKYLKKTSLKYQTFFDTMYSKDILDTNKRNIILCEEEKMLVINAKNNLPLIIGKIKYLVEIQKQDPKKIIILVKEKETSTQLKQEIIEKQNLNVTIQTIQEYSLEQLEENNSILDSKKQYQILRNYIMEELFPKKEKFRTFYHAFQPFIYLNKDYKDFETFKDYHNYMYKRMFLSSGLSLKKYNEKEIKKRKTYLRTIENETANTKEEVDIANFLYLNKIPYQYLKEESSFIIYPNDKNCKIIYKKELSEKKEPYQEQKIFLTSKSTYNKNYLEDLVYELIKRRYPMEKRTDEEIYQSLKDTTMDSYFNEVITKQLIPLLTKDNQKKNWKETKLNQEQQKEMQELMNYYQKYLQENHYLEEEAVNKKIETSLEQSNYQFLITLNISNLNPSCINHLKINAHYQELELVKENIKLLYDYKNYLHKNKKLSPMHTYIEEQELDQLTNQFLIRNLNTINKSFEKNQKPIAIYFYEDNNRLLIYKKMSEKIAKILDHKDKKDSLLLGVKQLNDINPLIGEPNFTKLDKHTIQTKDNQKIKCGEIRKLDKNYDIILLPFLILDSYHEELFKNPSYYQEKVILFTALSHCKKKVYLLCPLSKKKKIENQKIWKNITIHE